MPGRAAAKNPKAKQFTDLLATKKKLVSLNCAIIPRHPHAVDHSPIICHDATELCCAGMVCHITPRGDDRREA
jgi:hypothetical protein